ncbi:RING-type E3 ubiquitin transferase [Melia azedarach]|uniref:RING-type E3 ubiquitin transferase n=1 Tax=Melia azedarach TaxID=155640 RepID=A0ACC1Y075_MELAZ|nr:RING-type E3 ubiquitin transferase [Melia azedarach]
MLCSMNAHKEQFYSSISNTISSAANPSYLFYDENASHGVDRIPTPKAPLNKFHFEKLVKDLRNTQLQMKTLRQLEIFAAENEGNRKYMAEVGVPKSVLLFIITCFQKNQVVGLEEAVSIFHFFRIPSVKNMKLSPVENDKIIESLTWVLGLEIENDKAIKSHALIVLKMIVETADSCNFLERLRPELFRKLVGVFRQGITHQGINAALHVMLDSCSWGRNRIMMVQSGAIFELIELELSTPEKRTTELILGILFHLCSSADGRAQFLSHRAAIAVVTRRILRVSPAADDRAILILSLICKFSTNNLVLQEMLKYGTVLTLCTFLQADRPPCLKQKAREILRSHYDEWKDSPCIDASVLTRLTR